MSDAVEEKLLSDAAEATGDDLVTPWDVLATSATGIDYDKVIRKTNDFLFRKPFA